MRRTVLAACIALIMVGAGAATAAPGDLVFKRCVEYTFGPEDCGRESIALNGANDLGMSRDGRSVYVPAIFGDALAHLRLNQKRGALRPVDAHCIDDVGGADTCPRQARGLFGVGSATVSPDGRFIYTTASSRATISILKRDRRTGSLRPRGCIEDDVLGSSGCPLNGRGMQGVTSVLISPDGRFAYASASSDDAVAMFRRNRRNGRLRSIGCVEDAARALSPDSSGCGRVAIGLDGSNALAFGPGARSVYYSGGPSDAIGRFARNRRSGRLEPRECVGDVDTGPPACARSMQGLDGPNEFATDSRRRFLHVAAGNGVSHAIATLRLRNRPGVLQPRGCLADADSGPASGCAREADGLQVVNGLAISPDDRFMYARASIDDTVVTLKRHRRTGRLTDRGCIADDDAPAPGSDCTREAMTINGGGSLRISRNSRWLLSVSQIEDAVSVFRRRP